MWNACFVVLSRLVMPLSIMMLGFASSQPLWAQGILENPQPGSFQSGIGLVSGWVCEASQVDIVFDDGAPAEAAYGTSREDTRSVCGDANNGFGLLFNWNLLGDGQHTVRALADGAEFGNATFTVTTLGTEFLRGTGGSFRLSDFPRIGTDVIMRWQESAQNFVIERVEGVGPDVGSMDAAGDSITKGFNAQSSFPCPNSNQEHLNWSTSETHGSNFCSDGSEGVFSHAERLECRKGGEIVRADPNSAVSGAQMLKDFVTQAINIKAFLSDKPTPRYATVWLGHNDICSGTIDKFQSGCETGSDQDPNNYCRTTPEAFEREFRKGLDILITVPDLKVGVASLVRVSQLCNHGSKQECSMVGGSQSCQSLWTNAAVVGPNLGLDHGICGSLTADCSDQRIIDAYETAKAYHDILASVTVEYAGISEGGISNVVTVGGETVGGATKVSGVRLVFSDALWVYKFTSDQLSCCDCFHPSILGQDTVSRVLFDGLMCSSTDVCCQDTGDSFADGLCTSEDTNGAFFPGFF